MVFSSVSSLDLTEMSLPPEIRFVVVLVGTNSSISAYSPSSLTVFCDFTTPLFSYLTEYVFS